LTVVNIDSVKSRLFPDYFQKKTENNPKKAATQNVNVLVI